MLPVKQCRTIPVEGGAFRITAMVSSSASAAMDHQRQTQLAGQPELVLEPSPLELPRRVIVEVVQTGFTDGYNFGPAGGQLPDPLQVVVSRLRYLVRVNSGGGPHAVVRGSQLCSDVGVFEMRGDGDDAGHTGLAGPSDDGRPIVVEAAVRQMAVAVEHRTLPTRSP